MKVDTQAVTSEVVHGESGHFIPFIIMEWTFVRSMPEFAACVDWMYDAGYSPHHWITYKLISKEDVRRVKGGPHFHDVIWLHKTADPSKLKP